MTSSPLFVFDLDGTLVDSRLDLAESANELLAARGAPALSVEAVVSMVGEGARVLVERVLARAGLGPADDAALDEFLRIYDLRLTNHTTAYPGVREALDAVAPMASLAVLTNKPGRHTRRLLDALGLTRYFAAGIIGGDSSWPRKPDPTSLRHLMTMAGTAPEQTLMIGDSMVDVETARRAGTRLCVAYYGFGEVPREVGFTPGAVSVTDPRELAACLTQVAAGSPKGPEGP